MKKGSKILVLMLSVALLLCGAVIAINAADSNVCKIGTTGYASVAEAVAAAEANSTVKLTANTEISETVNVTKNLTIDLNGKTLTVSGTAFKLETAGVSFTVTGKGYIKSAGTIVDACVDSTVNITGTSQGIVIDQAASTDTPTIASAGTVNMTNVFANVSTPLENGEHFKLTGNAHFYGEKLSVNVDMSFGESNWYTSAVFSLCDSVYIKLTDSSINTPATAFIGRKGYDAYRASDVTDEGGTPVYADTYGDAIELNNVYIYGAKAIYYMPDDVYNYFSYDSDNSDGTSEESHGGTAFGTINVTGGALKCDYRVFVGNLSQDNLSHAKGFKINLKDAVILSNNTNSYLFIRMNYNVTIDNCLVHFSGSQLTNDGASVKDNDGNSIESLSKAADTAVKVTLGTRFSRNPSDLDFVCPDGKLATDEDVGYEIVFDPVGSLQYPYALVEKGTAQKTVGFVYPFYKYTEGGAVTGNDGIVASHFATKTGVERWVLERDSDKNIYALYEIYKEGLNAGDKIKFADYSTVSDKKYDSFYVIGAGSSYNEDRDIVIPDNKVVVYSFNMSSGSEYGYIDSNFKPQARKTSDGAGNSDSDNIFKIESNELIECKNTSNRIKLDNNRWYNFTIICDTVNNIAYYYVDGKAFTTSTVLTDKTIESFFCGIRINPYNSQTVGASLAFDNISCAGYSEAIYTDSTNATLDVSKYLPATENGNKMISSNRNEASIKAPYLVNGMYLTSLNDALKKGTVILTDNVTTDEVITENGYVYSSGYELNVGEGSNAMLISGEDSNTLGKVYSIDSAYNNYTVDVYWYVGGSDGDLTDLANKNGTNFVKTELKAGEKPIFKGTIDDRIERTTKSIISFTGEFSATNGSDVAFEFKPLTANEVIYYSTNDQYLTYYAIYEHLPLDYEVVNSKDASYYEGGTGADKFYAALVSLKDGDTIRLLTDIALSEAKIVHTNTLSDPEGIDIDDDYTSEELATMKEYAEKIAIDLAGNKFSWVDTGAEIMVIGSNTQLNVYSSLPGGIIEKLGKDNTTAVSNTRAFAIAYGPKADTGWGTYNAHIEIGEYNGQYAGNLTTYTAILVEALSGDSSCSITVSGGTYVRATSDSASLFLLRVYNGTLNLRNSVFFMAHSVFIEVRNADSGDENADPNPTSFYSSEKFPTTWKYKRIQQKINVEDSYLITANNTSASSNSNILNYPGLSYNDNGTKTYTELVFKNVYTNARLNPGEAFHKNYSENGKVYVEGTCYAPKSKSNPVTDTKSGTKYTIAKANIPFDLPWDMDYIVFPTRYVTNGQVVTGYGYVSLNGADVPECPDGEYLRETVLPMYFEEATTASENTVSVTFKDLAGNNAANETYVKGGNAIYAGSALADLTANVYTESHTGEWAGTATNVQETTVLTPVTEKTLNVDGFKMALTLYSDFTINLYVPSKYESYITDTGAHTPLNKRITIGSEEYLVLTAAVKPNEVVDDTVFSLTFTEGDFEDSCTFTYSILDYASIILEDSKLESDNLFTDDDYSLMWYILNYAYESYRYFATSSTQYTDEIAALSEALTTYADVKNVHGEYTFGNKISSLELGTVFKGATLSLTAAPKFLLVLNEDFTGNITVSYVKNSGSTVTLSFTEADAITIGENKCILIEGMKAYEFLGDLTISADGTVGEDSATVSEATYNLDSFAAFHVANAADSGSATKTDSEECLALVNAFYAFVTESLDYVTAD